MLAAEKGCIAARAETRRPEVASVVVGLGVAGGKEKREGVPAIAGCAFVGSSGMVEGERQLEGAEVPRGWQEVFAA